MPPEDACALDRLQNHEALGLPVQKQLLQVVAVLIKRGWLEDGETEASGAAATIFERLPRLLEGGVQAQIVVGRLLLMLTNEFSFGRASAVGLAWERHVAARSSFQQVALPRVFSLACSVLRHHSQLGDPAGAAVASSWLRTWMGILTNVLTWDFASTAGDMSRLPTLGQSEITLLQPGPSWRSTLTDGSLVELLFNLVSVTQASSDADLASLPRQALLALCCLDGAVFESKPSRASFLNGLLERSMVWLASAVPAAEAAAGEEGAAVAAGHAVMDGAAMVCQLFRQLGKYRLALFTSWDEHLEPPYDCRTLCAIIGPTGLGAVTAFALRLPCGAETDTESAVVLLEEYGESLVQVVLQAWHKLLPPERPPAGSGAPMLELWQAGSAQLRYAVAQLVDGVMSWRVQRAALLAATGEPPRLGKTVKESMDGKFGGDMLGKPPPMDNDEEELTLLGHLARSAPTESCQLFAERFLPTRREAVETAANSAPVGAQTRLQAEASLACVLDALTAVATRPEQPHCIPTQLVQASLDTSGAGTQCHIVAMLHQLHEVASLTLRILEETVVSPSGGGTSSSSQVAGAVTMTPPQTASQDQSGSRQGIDSTLLTILMDCLGRVASAYFGIGDHPYAYPHGVGEQLKAACCLSGPGNSVLNLYVAVACAVLRSPVGATTQTAAATLLLRLAHHKVLRPLLLQLTPWLTFARNVAGAAPPFNMMAGSTKRVLACALVTAGLMEEPAGAYIAGLRQTLVDPLTSMVSQPSFAERVNAQPEILLVVVQALHGLRGVVQAERRSVYCSVIMDTLGVLQCLTCLPSLLNATAGCLAGGTDVVVATLKFLAALVDSHDDELGSLADEEDGGGAVTGACSVVYATVQACFEAVAAHSSILDAQLRAANAAEAAHQRYRRARALLKLCTVFWPRATMCGCEFGEEASRETGTLVQVLFGGLVTILPTVDIELLHVPGVCRQFFEHVQVLVDCFPSAVARMEPQLFRSLTESLAWGLESDVETANTQLLCLQTMAVMAEHAYRLGGNSTPQLGAGEHDSESFETMLGASSQNGAALLQWMHALLTKLLFGDAMSVELVHIASELTLALILCYEQPFHALVQRLVGGRPAEQQPRLIAEFEQLMTAQGLTKSLSHDNKKKFRANFTTFVSGCRGFLLIK